jgi:hypothetical protein
MPTYVVAARREAQTGSLTAEDHVRQVPGIWIKGGTDPDRITIEASEVAAAEIEHRFGSVLLIEPEIHAEPQPGEAYGSLPYEGPPKTLDQMEAGRRIIRKRRDALRELRNE